MRIHPEAAREARAARRWYSDRNADAGARVLIEYTAAITSIIAAPEQWPTALGARRYRFGRFPYSVFYDLSPEGEPLILAVAHDRRRPGFWRRRSVSP